MKKFEIPFDKNGNLLSYPSYYDIIYKDNFEFTDTLTFAGFERGRSAAHAIFTNTEGKNFPMFLTDLSDLIEKNDIYKGVISGKFTFQKRGQNFGIKMIS